jgi:hypothetical protein
MPKYTHISIQYHIKFKFKLLQIKCRVLEFTKDELLGTLSLLGVWPNSILINSEKLPTKLNDPHFTEIENFEFKSRF